MCGATFVFSLSIDISFLHVDALCGSLRMDRKSFSWWIRRYPPEDWSTLPAPMLFLIFL